MAGRDHQIKKVYSDKDTIVYRVLSHAAHQPPYKTSEDFLPALSAVD